MKYRLEIEFPTTSPVDLDRLIELETALMHTLSNQHIVDGHDFGAGTMTKPGFSKTPADLKK